MPPKQTATSSGEHAAMPGTTPVESGAFQLPWTAIPRFSPGVTDVTEYSGKLQFLAAMWPQEHLHLLAPRAALLCEGTAFKKVSKIPAEKLKSADESGIKLLVATLGGSWGKTALEEKYDTFEKAIYSTAQKADETNDSYLARHDVHFEELLAKGVTMEEIRAYVLLRQSQLSSEDRKKIVVEMGGKLEYSKIVSAIRLLGSRFFADLQGQRTARTKTYDANVLEEAISEEPERAFQASVQGLIDEAEPELDAEFVEAMVAADDPDALAVQGFEEELEGFFQDTPDLQEALVSYLEARQKLLSKKRSRGFWLVSAKGGFKGAKGIKGRGKGGKGGRDQLLARIARSHCRICGAKGHWKAECPQKGKTSTTAEATTTVAEVINGDSFTAAAEQPEADEILTQVPTAAMSLAEAHFAWEAYDKQRVLNRLSRMVVNLRLNKSPPYPSNRLKRSGATSLTEAAHTCSDHQRTEQVDSPAHALFSTTATDAILDTGASRCVMGKSLLKGFINQLSEAVRNRIRMVKSSVRFRFGNNQTLLSDRRVLLPFQTAARQILWLSIEVVPGSTPLLFSKKAIKQLGGLIDTETDTCHLRRLRKSLQMRVGPTGLYLIDLARLCEESNLTSECLSVCEDVCQKALNQDLCMTRAHALKQDTTSQRTDKSSRPKGLKVWNSQNRSFKRPDAVNVSLQKPKGSSVRPESAAHPDQEVSTAAVIASNRVLASVPASPSTSKPHHGPEACPSASGSKPGARSIDAESRSTVQSPPRSLRRLHGGGCADNALGEARGDQDSLRKGDEGPHLRGHLCERACLGSLDAGPHGNQQQDGACGLHHLRAPSGGRGRDDRSPSLEPRRRFRCPRSQAQGGAEECPCPSSRGPRVGEHLGPVSRAGAIRVRVRSPRAGDTARRALVTDGGTHATDDSAPQPELTSCLSEVWDCQRELELLVAQSQSPVHELEPKAKRLLEQEASLSQLKSFLKTVPWDLLSPASCPERSCVVDGYQTSSDESREPAYVMFGMFVHGGITGVTKVTKAYPFLSRVLARIIQLTNPQHEFTSIGVSVNQMAQPHKDSYNSRDNPNLIIPLEYPLSGGEVWVAKPPLARQVALSRQRGRNMQAGSLQVLKPGMKLDPHVWHASQPWSGNRSIVVAYSLKPLEKLQASERKWLREIGFYLPKSLASPKHVTFSEHLPVGLTSSVLDNSRKAIPPTPLREELDDAKRLLQSSVASTFALVANQACAKAFAQAEQTAWDVFQDSQLAYQRPVNEQLDVLEVYAAKDSRLTQAIQSWGGRARRFTKSDGDLRTIEGQRALWDVLQETQPRHIWLSPSCRAWCSWSNLHGARGASQALEVHRRRQEDAVHLQLCAKIFLWQVARGRHFHLEQPAQSKMLDTSLLEPILSGSRKVLIDMCCFGLKTPVTNVAIRKRTCILSTDPDLIRSLVQKQCPGHSEHQPVSGRPRQLGGSSLAQYAGSYCQGFADHVAQQLLPPAAAEGFAVDTANPLTRKRQKTTVDQAIPINRFGAQKRSCSPSMEGDSRSQAQPRTTESNAAKAGSILSEALWKPIFEMVSKMTSKVAHH